VRMWHTPGGVLREASSAHLAEAPESLHHVRGVLTHRADARSLLVHLLPVPVQRLPAITADQIRELVDVGLRRVGGDDAVHQTLLVGADVHLHPGEPDAALPRLPHLGIAGAALVHRRVRRCDEGGVDDRPLLQEETLLLSREPISAEIALVSSCGLRPSMGSVGDAYRLHRGMVQPAPAALRPRLPVPAPVRAATCARGRVSADSRVTYTLLLRAIPSGSPQQRMDNSPACLESR